MSYDIRVWSVREPAWTEILVPDDGWLPEGSAYVLRKTSWQIIVGPPQRVEDEDIPDEVIGLLPGIQYLSGINLEPIHAPESARKTLKRLANRLARESLGVVEDPQEDSITTARGVHRVAVAPPEPRSSVLNLSWWFNESPLLEEAGRQQLLAIMERLLPEALPKRYGPYEPPPYHYDREGKEHLLHYLATEQMTVVWYAHYPVLYVTPNIYRGHGPFSNGYLASHLEIEVHAAALSQPGWQLALERFWIETSELVRPFYGEVRTLTGYIVRKGRAWLDANTEDHPVRNGWWNGIPSPPGLAVVLGEPYAGLWPRFARRSEQRGGLYFASVPDWLSGGSVERLVGRVPKELRQGKYARATGQAGRSTTYPRIWPFAGPFAEG